jgi:hypothetical protein
MATTVQNQRTFLNGIPEIAQLYEHTDYVDPKMIEGNMTLREFLAGFHGYQPAFVTFLYRVRWVFVRLLGMTQEGIPRAPELSPDDIPMTPGDKRGLFPVIAAEEERYWIAGEDDVHLNFKLAVAVEPLEGQRRRFHVVTFVYYNKFIGRIYFAFIAPFHHLIVRHMMWSVVRRWESTHNSSK